MGPAADDGVAEIKKADGVFTVEDLGEQITPYFEGRDPHRTYAAYSVAALDDTGTSKY